jgi:drug/metabolite transporter (DMT)-like permease
MMDNKTKGIISVLISSLSFATMNVFIRFSGDLPTTQKILFRNLIALVIASILLYKSKQKVRIKRKNIFPLIARCIFGLTTIICNFYAVDHLLLSDATIITKLAPFFTIIFCYIFLKEVPRRYQIIGIIIAFIGVYFVANPAFNDGNLVDYIIAMIGAISMGLSFTFLRKCLNNGEQKTVIVFLFSLFSTILILPVFIYNYTPMTLFQLAMLLSAGLCAACGQFSLTFAYYFASAKDVSIYEFFQLIWAAFYAYFIFSESFRINSIFGYLIITLAAVFIFIKEKHSNSIQAI